MPASSVWAPTPVARQRSNPSPLTVAAKKVEVVDTTAAGDTFIGYYLASVAQGMDVQSALERANAAAAITVTRLGAVSAIPFTHELTN